MFGVTRVCSSEFGIACELSPGSELFVVKFDAFEGPSMRYLSVRGTWAFAMGVAGPRLRTALTGRVFLVGADPGLHPGL